MQNQHDSLDTRQADQAIARRLAKLAAMPVDTSRIDLAVRKEIGPPPASLAASARRLPWWGRFRPLRTIAASLLVLAAVVVTLLLTNSNGPALASPNEMIKVHEDLVAGRLPAAQVGSIEEANKLLAEQSPHCPDLPNLPPDHQMACCMKSVKDKKMACLLMRREGVPVSLMVAHGKDMRSPTSPVQVRNGVTYQVQQVGNLNMVMTERQGRWLCLIGELPVERLMDVADQLRFQCQLNVLRLGVIFLLLAGIVVIPGCVLAPPEAADEQAKAHAAGLPYTRPFDQRDLPELPLKPTWPEVLHRSLLASGELEAAYYEWAAAAARIDQAGSYPNTPLSLGFGYMFSAEKMKSFDRSTFSAAPDPMDSLSLPPKVYQAAKVALAGARVAGIRFVAAKFELQQKVIVGWYEYALQAERVRIRRGHLELLGLIRETAAGRVRAGGAQVDMLRADVEDERARDELQTMEAELPRMQAMLNALAGRPVRTPLEPADALPPPRVIPADDAELLVRASQTHPTLQALAYQVQGRADALELARLQFLPDFNPSFAFTGTVSQAVGLAVSIPGVMPKVRAMVQEADANLKAAEAVRRQARLDHGAEVVATLYALRNSERQAALFEQTIIPTAQRIVDNIREGYSRGSSSFIDLIEAQRTLLDARLTAAEARGAREMRLAELEAMIGVDAEAMKPATTQPATRP